MRFIDQDIADTIPCNCIHFKHYVFKLLHYNMRSSYPIWSYLPGNREGKIFVWELQSSPPVLIARLVGWFCLSWLKFVLKKVATSVLYE